MLSAADEGVALLLWEFSFIPLWLTMLALASALGLGFFYGLTHNSSIRPIAAVVVAGVLGAVVFVALVFSWTVGIISPPVSGPIPFNADDWHVKPWMRLGMASDMVESDYLLGMREDEVLSLLGHGDGSYRPTPGPGSDNVVSWRLYRPQDLMIPRPPELVVIYEAGSVTRAWIQPWNIFEEVTYDSRLE